MLPAPVALCEASVALLLPLDYFEEYLVGDGRAGGRVGSHPWVRNWFLHVTSRELQISPCPSGALAKPMNLVGGVGAGGRDWCRRLFVPSDARQVPLDVSICLRAFGIAGCGFFSVVRSGAREGA
jgi:hypothetical protein